MDFERIKDLRENDPALRLLRADHLPLVASFLHAAFIRPNRRSIPLPELESLLDDRLIGLRLILGEEAFPRTARQYLDEWCHPTTSFLRKYYVEQGDEPHCDLMPSIERALEWLRSTLEERPFVGTESRLLTLFQLLREFVLLTERDPETRIRELEAERAAIDAEIEKVRSGAFAPLNTIQAKERFFQIEETARRLLGDFRQVEENFRNLDRETRERIATSAKRKGALLDEVFGEQDVIWESEQGRSFRAFWEFLMSSLRQEELDNLLTQAHAREEVMRLEPDPFLRAIRFSLLEAADKVYRTNSRLVEQLRKFLDDRAQHENRRIMELIRSIEKNAVELKEELSTDREMMALDETRPSFDLVMSRGLYIPPSNPIIADSTLKPGDPTEGNADGLFEQVVIDERRLRRNIDSVLARARQATLKNVLEEFPLERGVAEIVVYIKIATHDSKALIDESVVERIHVPRADGRTVTVDTPRVLFLRK